MSDAPVEALIETLRTDASVARRSDAAWALGPRAREHPGALAALLAALRDPGMIEANYPRHEHDEDWDTTRPITAWRSVASAAVDALAEHAPTSAIAALVGVTPALHRVIARLVERAALEELRALDPDLVGRARDLLRELPRYIAQWRILAELGAPPTREDIDPAAVARLCGGDARAACDVIEGRAHLSDEDVEAILDAFERTPPTQAILAVIEALGARAAPALPRLEAIRSARPRPDRAIAEGLTRAIRAIGGDPAAPPR